MKSFFAMIFILPGDLFSSKSWVVSIKSEGGLSAEVSSSPSSIVPVNVSALTSSSSQKWKSKLDARPTEAPS